MSFDHSWVLLVVWLPLAWVAWEWRRPSRRGAVLLKGLSLAAILLALCGPRLTVFETRVAVAVLADTSSSITERDLGRASELATRMEKERGRNWSEVVPFARATRAPTPNERRKSGWRLENAAAEAAQATNIEAAIHDGLARLPAGYLPRLLVISDGNDNAGSVSRAIWQAQQLGVPVDTVALEGRPKPDLVLQSVSLPAQVFSGERFPIEVVLEAPRAATATVEIAAEGKDLGSSRLDLVGGVNRVRMHASVNTAGAVQLSGRIASPGLGEARFSNALVLRRPRVLLVSGDPPATESHLTRALEANQFEVRRSASGMPEKLDEFQLLVFNNWSMEAVPAARAAAIEQYVKQGGGLLWLAGERNEYTARPDRPENPLERTLPAKLAPPRSPEGTCVVLIVDKSSSMEGRKMELARVAAVGVVQNLRPFDSVGVLIFDNSFEWAVPIRKADDPAAIARLIAGIAAEGGTQIAPALSEAYRRILPHPGVQKHIVLLTDGISEEGDSFSLARTALANRITISTVGLGQDVNRSFLERIASLAEGRSYFLSDPSGLEQLLLRDVQEHTGTTAVERSVRVNVSKGAEILEGVGMEQAPPLRGYIRFIARPTADTILEADHRDPLLVRWQYGLGRAAVFASDAKSRWATAWVGWPGYDRLWANLFRDLLPHAQASEATAELDRANNELVVDYHLARNLAEPPAPPELFAFGPDGFQQPLQVTKAAAGHYRGRLAAGQAQGMFRIRPLAESRAFPELGLYRQEDELTDYGSNRALLQQLASSTGGRFNPDAADAFDPRGRSIPMAMQLWPGLLALAIVLNLAEVILRKWRGFWESLVGGAGFQAG